MKKLLLILSSLFASISSGDEITGMNLRVGSTSIPQTPTATPSSILTLDANKRPVFTNAPSVSGQTLTGSQTTPVLDLSTTWSTSGVATAIKLNVTDTASNASSLLMELQQAGNSVVRFGKRNAYGETSFYTTTFSEHTRTIIHQSDNGGISFSSNAVGRHFFLVGDTTGGGGPAQLYLGAPATITWQSTNRVDAGVTDLVIGRDAAATLQLGTDHATTPTAQTIKAHDVTTGTGASLTIAGGKGSVAGGGVTIATSATNGAPISRIDVKPNEIALTDSTDTTVVNIALADGKYLGGELIVTTHADDGTDFQAITEHLTFSAVNNTGAVTATIQTTPSTSTPAASTGTLTTGWSIVANGDGVDIKNNASSSLTETTLKCSYQLRLNTDGAGTVTP